MRPPSVYVRALALAAHFGLVIGLLAWSRSWLGLLVSLPLFAPLPGLLRGRDYTYAWASLLLVFYCAALLAEGVAMPAQKAPAWALAAVAALEFSALVLFVRLRSRERAAASLAASAGSPAAQKAG